MTSLYSIWPTAHTKKKLVYTEWAVAEWSAMILTLVSKKNCSLDPRYHRIYCVWMWQIVHFWFQFFMFTQNKRCKGSAGLQCFVKSFVQTLSIRNFNQKRQHFGRSLLNPNIYNAAQPIKVHSSSHNVLCSVRGPCVNHVNQTQNQCIHMRRTRATLNWI